MQLSASVLPPPEEEERPEKKNDGDVGDASMREKEKGDPEMELALPLSSRRKVPTASPLALQDVKVERSTKQNRLLFLKSP